MPHVLPSTPIVCVNDSIAITVCKAPPILVCIGFIFDKPMTWMYLIETSKNSQNVMIRNYVFTSCITWVNEGMLLPLMTEYCL